MQKKAKQKIDGWINFYKPKEMTSTQAVGAIKRILSPQKIGHAGTLDPLAEGILPLALGEATKTVSYTQDAIKTYSFDVVWGEQRSTDDPEGDVINTNDHRPNEKEIKNILPEFIGQIEQTPPKFSALKIDGKRAYDLARKGEEFEIKTRLVNVISFELQKHSEERTTFTVTCGKGTYIRSLGRDLAIKLGSCAYVDNLKREKVGIFNQNNAIFLDKLDNLSDKDALSEALLPVDTGLDDIPVLDITEDEATRLRQGQLVSLVSKADFKRIERFKPDQTVRAYCNKSLIGLVTIMPPRIQPLRIFNLINKGA